ncbi:MAG: Hcp family type VI secretion system effector [Roseiarcus sp.]
MAQSDIFLQIDSIEGESRDEKKQNQIELVSFTVAGLNSGNVSAGGKAKVNLADIRMVKHIDKSSPNLFANLCNGQKFTATVTVRKAGGSPVDYVKIELKSCIISSYTLEVRNDSVPVENFSLAYAQIAYSYWTQDSKGSLGPVIMKSYNLMTNVLS